MPVKTTEGRFLWAIGGKIEERAMAVARRRTTGRLRRVARGRREISHALDDTTVYSIEEDRWYSSARGELAPMPYGVQGAGWTLHEGVIYCFGGKTRPHSGCVPYVQAYDIADDQWTVLPSMPAARSKLGKFYPVYEGHYVFLFGGDNIKGRFHRVSWNWRYDLEEGTWDADVADAPFSQSFPCPSLHDGWLYYTTGNTSRGPRSNYPGGINQRYNPHTDEWQVVAPCPHPVTDGSGDVWRGELHFLGGWNPNTTFYHRRAPHFKGPVKRLHSIYNYESNSWHYAPLLPGRWHHGGTRSDGEYLWHYLGTIDEETGKGEYQHTNRIHRWDGETWTEKTPAPVRKMNFGTIFTTLGPTEA
ncbi:MAG: hypothetical protein ACLFV5_10445 [Anaerolineales bacterium]